MTLNLSINNAGYANQPGPMQSIKFPTVAGAVDYHRTWTVNAYGPLLFSSALLDAGLIRGTEEDRRIAETIATRPPVIANISSGQASLSRAAEMFDGGGTRDDLFFHQVYAGSKVALSGVTMHMARVLRVSRLLEHFVTVIGVELMGRVRSLLGKYIRGGSRLRWAGHMPISHRTRAQRKCESLTSHLVTCTDQKAGPNRKVDHLEAQRKVYR